MVWLLQQPQAHHQVEDGAQLGRYVYVCQSESAKKIKISTVENLSIVDTIEGQEYVSSLERRPYFRG